MAMSSAARARETAFGGGIELRIPFGGGEALREALKDAIPKRFREWDPDDKVWRVMGAWAPTAIDLLLEHFPNAETPGDRARPGRLVARTERLPTTRPPLPPLIVETPADRSFMTPNDQ